MRMREICYESATKHQDSRMDPLKPVAKWAETQLIGVARKRGRCRASPTSVHTSASTLDRHLLSLYRFSKLVLESE